MKSAITVILFSFFASLPLQSSAQISQDTIKEKLWPFEGFTEQIPEYPGGPNELIKFLQRNFKFPPTAKENMVQGKVIVRFLVVEDGSVDSIVVMRNVDPDIDAEVVRVVRLLHFKPAMANGKPVRVPFTLPVFINF